MDPRAQEILDYWIGGVGEVRWYAVDEGLDRDIRTRFEGLWHEARSGALDVWTCQPESCLALVILLDQFPRNMFRGSVEAYATDAKALAVAKAAIARGFDERVGLPERQFFYLPLMHSEALTDQERSVRLIALNFGEGNSLAHARAHREIIRRFGRFPYRNAVLGRSTTGSERAFLEAGGYDAVMESFAA
jgi:uncharacterized protein (DUF924 family)